jgi:uncharacterized lipoprotein YmbA
MKIPRIRQGMAAVRAASLATVLAFAGCSTTPPPERFHTLLSDDPTAATPVAQPIYVDLLPVGVPPQVDHRQWVLRQPDGSLRLLEQDRWAAALPDELRGAIVERLAAAWGAVDVRGVARPMPPVWRIRVDVQRFESVPGREARLDAIWSLSSGVSGAAAQVCRDTFTEPVAAGGVPALAAAHRRAVVRLADSIGQHLKRRRADGTSGC